MKAVVFDRDDTLADTEGGSGTFNDGTDAGWLAFNDQLINDIPIEGIMDWWRSVPPDVAKIIVTGREESTRPLMEKWAIRHNLKFDRLIMRSNGDRRSGGEFKREVARTALKGNYTVLYAIDDDPEALDAWRSEGFLAIDANDLH